MPNLNRDLVLKKVRQVFPNRNPEEVMVLLDSYGLESYEQEQMRVQFAILKLCEEEGLFDPSRYLKAAKKDYRDVLAWAEYPGQTTISPSQELEPAERQRIIKEDLEQYQCWLLGRQ